MGAQMDAFEARRAEQDQGDKTYTFRSPAAQKNTWELTVPRNARNYEQSSFEDRPPEIIEENHEETQEFKKWYLSPAAKAPIRPRLPQDWYTGYTKGMYQNSLDDVNLDDEDEREVPQIRRDVRPTRVAPRPRRHVEFSDTDDNFANDDDSSWSHREKRAQLYRPGLRRDERPREIYKNGAYEEENHYYEKEFSNGIDSNNLRSQALFNGRFNTERAHKRIAMQEPKQFIDDHISEENGANFYPSRNNNRFVTGKAGRYDTAWDGRNFSESYSTEEQWPFRKAAKPVPDFVERFAMDAARRNGVTQTNQEDLASQDRKVNEIVTFKRTPTFLGEQPTAQRLPIKRNNPRLDSSVNTQRTAGTQTMFRNRSLYESRQRTMVQCGEHVLDKLAINIGFVGGPKTGKSSLINALRNLSKDDVGYAGQKPLKTRRGAGKYELPQITPYNCTAKGMENSVLWEIPLQTPMNGEQFIQENSLHEFDMIFLVIAGAINKDEVEFASVMNACGKPFAFVLSGCDSDMKVQEVESDSQPFGRFKARFEQKARSVFNSGIADIAPGLSTTHVFFVSAPVIRDRIRIVDSDEAPSWIEKYAIDDEDFLNTIQELCQVTG
uniref:IRG-type G domain-containing protein n=1 Tax=Plectus sambesii TaxID=2011161 RepID=A0A914W254_9BILA